VGIIGVAYLVGMSTYTIGSIIAGLLTDKLASEYITQCIIRVKMHVIPFNISSTHQQGVTLQNA